MHKNKVLILGSQGTLGQALVHEFSQHGYVVVDWDKSDLDITKKGEVEEKISSVRPDIIINASAYNAVDKIEEEEQAYQVAVEVNGEGPGYLAESAVALSIPLVHYSTDYVFSGENIDGYKEDDVPHPISKYADTKLMGEKNVQEKTDKYYTIRISRLFGKPGTSEFSKKSFVDIMKKLVLEDKKEHLDIVSDQFSCPSYAPDVAKFTRVLIEEQFPFGIYHGANVGACSWFEWAKEIFQQLRISVDITPVPASHFPRAAKAPMHSELLHTKGPRQRNWQEALSEYLHTS